MWIFQLAIGIWNYYFLGLPEENRSRLHLQLAIAKWGFVGISTACSLCFPLNGLPSELQKSEIHLKKSKREKEFPSEVQELDCGFFFSYFFQNCHGVHFLHNCRNTTANFAIGSCKFAFVLSKC